MSPVTARKRISREESRAQTRLELLTAARELFARQGFEGASIDQITDAAGYTRGAFYSNFDTKESLMIALIEHCFAEDLAQLSRLGERPEADFSGEGFQELSTGADADQTSHLIKMEFWMCAMRYPRIRAAYVQQQGRLRAAIARQVEAQAQALGLTLPVAAQDAAVVLIALRNGLDTQKLINPQAFGDGLYATMFRQLLRPDPPLTP